MLKKGVTDTGIKELLDLVDLAVLYTKWGLEEPQNWHDIFSGGQR